MPIYEYRCPECTHLFEAIRPMDDDGSELDCPGCGRRGPEKVLSVVGAVGTSSASSSTPCGRPAGGACGASRGFT